MAPFFEYFSPLIFGSQNNHQDSVASQSYKDAATTLKTKGYYAIPLTKKLTLIAMNSLFHDIYNKNIELTIGRNQDFGNQTSFLINELTKATNENKKVIILGHIPPGILFF